VSVAICLLLYSFVVAVFGPRLLVRLTRTVVAPRLAVTAWLAAISSVLISWAVAVGFLAVDVMRHWGRPGRVVNICIATLRQVASGGSGLLLQAALLSLTAAATAALGVVGLRLGRSLLRARTRTHQHAMQTRVVGRRVDGLDAVVLDAPERAAYCVAGRPNTIVVTSAALDALDDRHLSAVLAHERAHLAGHHHQILSVTRGLAAILPWIDLFTTADHEVARLLEMCADDAAARRHGSRTLLRALLALSGCAPLPRGALGATGVDVVARAERLATPVAAGDRLWGRTVLGMATLLVAAGPLLTGLLAAFGLAACTLP
jgi:Zn-dependent protease with chaperone function